MSLELETKHLNQFVSPHELLAMESQVTASHNALQQGTGLGNDALGWLHLPSSQKQEDLQQIIETASWIRENSQVFFVVGIGGSYLGAKAAIEFLNSPFYNQTRGPQDPEIYFLGNSLSSDTLEQILALTEEKDFSINIISKSGTTTEPAVVFRLLRERLIAQYGVEGASKRIFCTTDKKEGTLKSLADTEGYQTFVIPDDIGGRYSVLTPVGLLPIAVAGGNILSLMEGATAAEEEYSNPSLMKNSAYQYAAYRNILNRKGKAIEVLVSYEPALALFQEWYKQLFGESEGKDGKGLYPSSMIFSTDLHSLGQYLQEGSRNVFETVLHIQNSKANIPIPSDSTDFDGLNFLAGQTLSQINETAMLGTILAHVEGGVPNLLLRVPRRDEHSLGQLFYFFQKACAMSGYLLGVNPFNQPGVELYKQNMFALLGKPGFEERKKQLESCL